MRLHRFYVNKPLGEELVVERASEEKELVHQMNSVLRLRSGDEVFLFSPQDPAHDFLYRIEELSTSRGRFSLLGTHPAISPYPVTLVMSLVKKDTFENIVRHATELGVVRIIPLLADRSEKKSLNFERLRAIAREASEQSGRGTVPEITPISSLDEAFSHTKEGVRILGSLHGSRTLPLGEGGTSVSVWVGPEGGWTEKEETLFEEEKMVFLKTVDTVMKADTAAVNLLSGALSHFFSRN